jgi:hypothetical protein
MFINASAFMHVSTNVNPKVKFALNTSTGLKPTINIEKLGSEINSEQTNKFPIFYSEINHGLIYYADHVSSDNKFISRDFLFSKFDSNNSKWEKPISLLKDYSSFQEINRYMNFHEIFITINNDIYSVDLRKSTFSPQKLNINTKYIETSPSLSPDRNTLYFVSNRPGGYGGKDIWSSERLSNGKWSEPVNMGSKINTAEDEESPFIMDDNATLCFSSKGHNSIGGYDIFISTRNDDGFWSNSESLGSPVNTTSDDFCYITDTYGKRAFYTSDKAMPGNQDIYIVSYNK